MTIKISATFVKVEDLETFVEKLDKMRKANMHIELDAKIHDFTKEDGFPSRSKPPKTPPSGAAKRPSRG